MEDIRNGVRQLARQRGSSCVAILTLALGIGLSSALFSVIHATMLRPLPYPNPEQLVEVWPELLEPGGTFWNPTPSMEDMRAWQTPDDVFSAVAFTGGAFRGRILQNAEPERITVMYFTEQYLSMYGVTPVIGRDFTREDCEPGAPAIALLGYGFWQSRYGGRADVIGTTIRLDDEVATIVGVLPSWFNATTQVSQPFRLPADEFASRGTGHGVEARLRPGVSLEEAGARLSARTKPSHGSPQVRAVVTSQFDSITARYRTTIVVFVGAVALIVLLAAVNVAGLLMARGAARQRELDVRAALGASRARLVRQLLTESLILAVPAGVIGVALAWLSLDAIVANVPMRLPENAPVTLNIAVLAATAALLVVTAIVAGLMPALRLSRAQAGNIMLRANRQMGSTLSRRSGQMLIAAEVALAVVLVAGAGLMVRTFVRISGVDLGFNAESLMTMRVMPISPSPDAHKQYYLALVQHLRTVPGVSSASLVSYFVLDGGTSYTSVIASPAKIFGPVFDVMPEYFETVGARLVQGRFLTEADYASNYQGVVMSESAARVLFGGAPAVGREVTRTGAKRSWVVLGVIADLRHGGPLNDDARDRQQVFFPFEPTKWTVETPMTAVVRYSRGAGGVVEQLQRIAQSIGPRVVVDEIRSSDELFAERVITPRRRLVLLSLLGALALALALVGVFGTTAYAVTRRTAEIGLRLAVGARPGQTVRTIVLDSVMPIVIGTAIGLGAAVLLTRTIQSFLFETTPTDPLTLASVAAVLIISGALAALVPALRAAGIDPASTLRTE
jgi:putative ABC transport system permease protein